MPALAKLLLTLGLTLTALGLLLWLAGDKLRWLGRLPGDIRLESDRGGFYFPIVTCIVLSIALSAILWLIRRFF